MKPKQLAAITRHGRNLLAIYPNAKTTDPVKLCKQLRRLEARLNYAALCYCNRGGIEVWSQEASTVLGMVRNLLGPGPTVIANSDARGYSLKIDSGNMRDIALYTDMGGNGIIAPEFDKMGA